LVNDLKADMKFRDVHGFRRLLVRQHDNTTIIFADIAGFTSFSATVTPQFLVECLNNIFMSFDHLAEKHQVEKIKTLGDCYMACCGTATVTPMLWRKPSLLTDDAALITF